MNRFLWVMACVLISLSFCAGCAKYWYQEGKTFAETKQDRQECFEELKKYSSNWRDMGDYEFKFMEDCMMQRGYRLVAENKLPLRVVSVMGRCGWMWPTGSVTRGVNLFRVAVHLALLISGGGCAQQ
jgi:hypothetical protein